MARRIWVSEHEGPARSCPVAAPDWEPAGELDAFKEKRLWRELRRELGVQTGPTSESVSFYLTAATGAPWVDAALAGEVRPAWLALEPYDHADVVAYSRVRARHWPSLSQERRPDGSRTTLPLLLDAVDGGYFTFVRL
ncbi:hypothetical protein [Nocardioides flavescens]|uniref:Uncharacterized protein n=1 Tax=Nocardioides flavescens TaxID=2691959 RepID=A0A6L7ERE1_9ACTN|nr:hypothetical protein [Nocardioides flavescens]MXG89863.1 hypothetical protein [Nocardioides flavescens]